MARKSGWQQFADNFSSAYGAINEYAKEGAIRDINERSVEEQFDDAGVTTGYKYGDTVYDTRNDTGGLIRPTDMQIQRQNFKDTQRAMSRYGDYKGAQEMGLKQATLESQQEANRLARDTHAFNVRKAGLDVDKAESDLAGQNQENVVSEAEGAVKVAQAKTNLQHNEWLTEYSSMPPEEGRTFLMGKCASTGGNSVFCDTIKATDAFQLHQKANVGAQLMASVNAALSKGQAGGQEELMAIIDAQDGIEGNVRFNTDESGAVSIVELDPEGNPTNAAPWEGKDWEDFSQNVMKRLDPVNAINITTKQQSVEESTAKVGLINAQTLEALQKAAGAGNSEKMAAIKAQAVIDFQKEVGGDYSRAKTKAEKDALLDMFKYEVDNFNNRRNDKGLYDAQTTGGIGNTGNTGNTGTTKLSFGPKTNATEVNTAPTPAPAPAPAPTPTPAVKKVLTKANVAEMAALDSEVTDIKAKVLELSKVRGLKSGGKARSEIQKLRKRLVGIEQRKYKIQN